MVWTGGWLASWLKLMVLRAMATRDNHCISFAAVAALAVNWFTGSGF
jgi:hypothetical protein